MKKILSLILALSFLICALPMNALALKNEGTLKWPEMTKYAPTDNFSDKYMRFLPLDNYTSMQNPPDFLWRPIPQAESYDLIVCSDKEMNDVKYSKYEIKGHFYNFTYPFESGVYYWSVRYKTSSSYSVWTEPRRFRIDENAVNIKFMEPEAYIDYIATLKKPLYYKPSDMKERLNNNEGKKKFDATYAAVKTAIEKNKEYDTSYTYKHGDGGSALNNKFWAMVSEIWTQVNNGCYVYATNGDTAVKDFTIKRLMQMTEFTYPPIDANVDGYLSQAANYLAIGYDTFYNVLTPSQKEQILAKIESLLENIMGKLFGERGKSIWEINPVASHEWGIGSRLISISLLMGKDIKQSEELIERLFALYVNLADANNIEDGTYQGGTGYLRYSGDGFAHTWKDMGIIDITNKPEYQNSIYQYLYLWPTNEVGPFGDESYHKPDSYAATATKRHAIRENNGYAKWMYDEIGQPGDSMTKDPDSVEAKAPIDLPKSRYFPDGGFAGLHSDLIDPQRISLYFRSSWWGSLNHTHADQNSFVINAYGEPLAIDSGFYPYYNSPHHANYARKTYAHNAITFNGGKGQPPQDIEAEGKITGFLTHPDFDFVSGDASKAYKVDKLSSPASLDTVKRDIVYIRPDTFIVIDDLKALRNEKASFEFWLNAEEDIKLYKNSNGAQITKGEAQLDATVIYPEKVTGRFIKGYAGPDLINHPKEVDYDTTNTPDSNQRNQQRVYFATKPVSETKMITTLDVHKKDYPAQYIKQERGEGYIKLSFEDGTVAYIQTGNNADITVDNYTFNGSSLVVKEESILLVNGTYVTKDGKKIIESDVSVTVAFGKNQLEVSSIENDANVKVYSDITKIINVKEELRREIFENENKYGIKWSRGNDYSEFSLYNGYYSMYLNGKILPGTPSEDVYLNLILDGEENTVKCTGYYDHDGNIKGNVVLKDLNGFYLINDMKNVTLSQSENIMKVNGSVTVNVEGSSSLLDIKKINESNISFEDDFNAMKDNADSIVEGENFISKIGVGEIANDSVYSFLSGGKIIQNISAIGEIVNYTIDVPEDGIYNLMINNVVYNTETPADLCIKIGKESVLCSLPVTNGPSGPNIARGTSVWGVSPVDWHVCCLNEPLSLKKGKNILQIIGLGGGNVKIDWIGLKKAEK